MSYATEVLADSPAGYWRLGEPSGSTAEDASPNNRDGTYSGGTPGAASDLVDGDTAVTFDGVDDKVTVAHDAAFALTGDLTLEAWVNPTDRANYYEIVGKNVANIARPFEWRLNSGSGIPGFLCETSNTDRNGVTACPIGAWSHVALTLSGTTYTHYLNGVLSATGTITGTRQTDGSTAVIIGSRADSNLWFKGGIDEVAIYPTALSGARVLAHYAANVLAAPPSLYVTRSSARLA